MHSCDSKQNHRKEKQAESGMHASYSKKKKLFYYIKVDVKVKQNRGTVFWYFVVHKEVMEDQKLMCFDDYSLVVFFFAWSISERGQQRIFSKREVQQWPLLPHAAPWIWTCQILHLDYR